MRGNSSYGYKCIDPRIYAYTSPNEPQLKGYTKIGYTERSVGERIAEQAKTAQTSIERAWDMPAIFDDTLEKFDDKAVHSYLRDLGYEQRKDPDTGRNTEWFGIDPDTAQGLVTAFRRTHGRDAAAGASSYTLRKEQKEAVEKTIEYFKRRGEGSEFLWNAKPRFGKTLAAYDLCKRLDAKRILIVTNRPVISDSWYNDYAKYMGESEYYFISDVKDLKDKDKYPLCRTRLEWRRGIRDLTGTPKKYEEDKEKGQIEFVSLQDLKGAKAFGGQYEKLSEIAGIKYDILIFDESHEAFDTSRTRVALNQIRRRYTLCLSGTPFKALADDRFPKDAIFNWTYADEQKAKRDWTGAGESPYDDLPQMNMYVYDTGPMALPELKDRAVDGDEFHWAFELNELFEAKGGEFIHSDAVDNFLNALSSDPKYLFASSDNEIRHSLWLLNRVDSARAMQEKLENHEYFSSYKVVLAAGDPVKEDDEKTIKSSLEKVERAVKDRRPSITLSVGQLTTGVTVPQWNAVAMLSDLAEEGRPERYVQAMFRVQTPYSFPVVNGEGERVYLQKEKAYVLDFNPVRALKVYDAFANDLFSHSSNEKPDSYLRQENSGNLLPYFPIWTEDDGEMAELDPSQILSYPVKIEASEAVRQGFKYNGLFQNIGRVLQSPKALDILPKVKEEEKKDEDPEDIGLLDFDLDPWGNPVPSPEAVRSAKERIFGSNPELTDFKSVDLHEERSKTKKGAVSVVMQEIVKPVLKDAKNEGAGLSSRGETECKRKMVEESASKLEDLNAKFAIREAELEAGRGEELSFAGSPEERKEVNEKWDWKREDLKKEKEGEEKRLIKEGREKGKDIFAEEFEKENDKEKLRPHIDRIKTQLRAFASSIPAFLMAYGVYDGEDACLTGLENLDENIPEDVFREVTGISKEDFRVLRDEERVFNTPVFNEAIKEFMRLRRELANYFDDKEGRDIFDYIPPQERNQIFTPKNVVKMMADLLEKEDPDCFSDPGRTFADLYMKSGLFIAEIVKRLYGNRRMRELFPDGEERLGHIFSRQVFGMAPSEITYNISLNFIFGFVKNDNLRNEYESHFAAKDASRLSEEGSLASFVEERFGSCLSSFPKKG